MVVGAIDWGQSRGGWPAPPHLDAVQRAVIEGKQLTLGYVARDRSPIQVGGCDLRSLTAQVAGFGAAIELLDPPEARIELARIGAELVAAYG